MYCHKKNCNEINKSLSKKKKKRKKGTGGKMAFNEP